MESLVLVVEDEPMVAELTCRMVATLGYRAECASTGQQAIALMDGGVADLDLLILDLMLPDMSGVEVAEAARERRPGARILFTSAYPHYQVHPPTLDGSAFLAKPYGRDDLAAAVDRILTR